MRGDIVVEFDCGLQSQAALRAAIYRLIGTATCQVEKLGSRWQCHLAAAPLSPLDSEALRVRFLDLVADENLRESIAAKTEPVRNLILSLAFGSLAAEEKADTNPQR
jgi:His-Xaa-Ser system protein HxsD